MKAWIGILVKSDNQSFLGTIENMIPHRLDTRLWDTEQYSFFRSTDVEGVEFVSVSLFFNDFDERASFKAALGGISGFLHAALPGSFVKMTKCWHDELTSNDCPVYTDELEYEEVIV